MPSFKPNPFLTPKTKIIDKPVPPKPVPPKPVPPKWTQPKPTAATEALADTAEHPSDVQNNVEDLIETDGSPYGVHSGKKPTVKKGGVDVDGKKLAIPLELRAAYVAYLRLQTAHIQIDNVIKCLNKAPAVDAEALREVDLALLKQMDAMWIHLGLDREFNLLMGDKEPATRGMFQ